MRNMLNTAVIPLAAIEQVAVRQVLAVSAGEQRFVSPAIGRPWRQTVTSGRSEPNREGARAAGDGVSYPVFVEERISQLAEDARTSAAYAASPTSRLALAAGVPPAAGPSAWRVRAAFLVVAVRVTVV